MKKIIAIIASLAVATVFAVAGCQKQEAPAPKPAAESTMTSTAPTPTAPMAAPEKK